MKDDGVDSHYFAVSTLGWIHVGRGVSNGGLFRHKEDLPLACDASSINKMKGLVTSPPRILRSSGKYTAVNSR